MFAPRYPRFKNGYRVRVAQRQGVFVLSERKQYLFEGREYEALIPLLDGQKSLNDIQCCLAGVLRAEEVTYAVLDLQARGFLVDAATPPPVSMDEYVDTLRYRPWHLLTPLPVQVTVLDDRYEASFLAALESVDLVVQPQANLHLVVTEDYLHPALPKLNAQALREERPWLLLKPTGTIAWIGPLLEPGQTGCWACMALRLQANPAVQYYSESSGYHTPLHEGPSFPLSQDLVFQLVARQIRKLLLGDNTSSLVGMLYTFDIQMLVLRQHRLVQNPRCPACGTPYTLGDAMPPLRLAVSQPVRFRTGGYRCCDLAATWEQYQHLISPVLGPVYALHDLAAPPNAPTYTAGVKILPSPGNHASDKMTLRSAWGKGTTMQQARVSALGEAIERYSGSFHGDEPRLSACFHELGDRAIHPNDCLLYSDAQYARRHTQNLQPADAGNLVMDPFDEAQALAWSPLWSLTHACYKYLPAAYCYYDYDEEPFRFCNANSNGCAAGHTLEEAILQGFLELVERDAVALWWYNRLARPGIALEHLNDPYIAQVCDFYEALQRDLWVLDLTSDLGISVFAAVSRRKTDRQEDLIIGLGAHFDPLLCLERALTEVNQKLNIYFECTDDGSRHALRSAVAPWPWWQTARLEQMPYLAPASSQLLPQRPNGSEDSPDLGAALQQCLHIADAHNLEVLVLDQTRPDIGLKVVRVVVPGLRPHWRRLGPGRLYDVPASQGWLPTPLTEDQLNLTSIFP